MPISGLLITLADDPRASEAAVRLLESDPRVEVGERRGPYLPVVAETDAPADDERFWRKLNEHTGILKVDLAFAQVDGDPPPARPRPRSPGVGGPDCAKPRDEVMEINRHDE
jgi:hypothetical protein